MASREMLSKILKNTFQTSLRAQQHPVKKLLSKNAPCIANVVYRKLSSSVIRKGSAEGPIEQRTPEEIKKYVEEECKQVSNLTIILSIPIYRGTSNPLFLRSVNKNSYIIYFVN